MPPSDAQMLHLRRSYINNLEMRNGTDDEVHLPDMLLFNHQWSITKHSKSSDRATKRQCSSKCTEIRQYFNGMIFWYSSRCLKVTH